MGTYVKVDMYERSHVTRTSDPYERWDADDTCSSWSFEGCKIVKKSDHWDLVIPEDVEHFSGFLLYVKG